MAAPFLESHCYLSKPGHGTVTLPREIPVENDPDKRQILKIANVQCTGLHFRGSRKTKDHLDNLLSKRSQISATVSQSVPKISLNLEDAVTQSQEHEFGVMILKHSLPNLVRNLAKRDHIAWDTRVAQIWAAGTAVAKRYHNTNDEQHSSSDPDEVLSLFDELVCRSFAKQLIANMLKKLDPGDNNAPPLVIELENKADIIPDNTLWAAIVIHIRRLLLLAVSPGFVRAIKNPAVVQCCPLREQSVTIYSHKSSSLDIPGLVSSFEKTMNVDIALHAELNVFQTLLEDALVKGSEAPIAVPGCQGKPYSSRAVPDLSFAEQYIGFNLNLKVRQCVEHFIQTMTALLEMGEGYKDMKTLLARLVELQPK
ncbi:hypothetical protein BDP27DRAFT_1416765 [Rhodocollybia butyracea]|uniref:Uncharacterized protein n=1 Tax=Rhodocollybia butyracea TaxID=206335 RepID=A0A9P5Q2U7_9AGAR|nr:hypothetical protein BDP27DRAFT_1416765 [Rhodocollybia butyracea]